MSRAIAGRYRVLVFFVFPRYVLFGVCKMKFYPVVFCLLCSVVSAQSITIDTGCAGTVRKSEPDEPGGCSANGAYTKSGTSHVVVHYVRPTRPTVPPKTFPYRALLRLTTSSAAYDLHEASFNTNYNGSSSWTSLIGPSNNFVVGTHSWLAKSASHGGGGTVWLDVTDDVQDVLINPNAKHEGWVVVAQSSGGSVQGYNSSNAPKLQVFYSSGDINADGVVDWADAMIINSNFGMVGASHSDGDLNADAIVNGDDWAGFFDWCW